MSHERKIPIKTIIRFPLLHQTKFNNVIKQYTGGKGICMLAEVM